MGSGIQDVILWSSVSKRTEGMIVVKFAESRIVG